MKKIEIEKALQWALREEVPKGRPVALSAWDAITSYGTLGTRIDVSRGAHDGLGFVPGTPHPDAESIGAAVAALPGETRLSAAECAALLGPYAALDPLAVNAVSGAPYSMTALVIRCAILGERMPWDIGLPQPRALRFRDNGAVIVFGVGPDGGLSEMRINPRTRRYDLDMRPRSHLAYDAPTVGEMLETRAEYAVWHRAITQLAAGLAGTLREHEITAPTAVAEPWFTGQAADGRVFDVAGGKMEKLPLSPVRPAMAAPLESDIERRAREWHQRRPARLRAQAKAMAAPEAWNGPIGGGI